MCVSDWIGHMRKKKKKKQKQTVDSGCTFYSVWQVAALSKFSECDSKAMTKKRRRRRISTAFFKSESMASSLWQISFCYPYIHKKKKTFQTWFICVSARREHWGPMYTMVSSRLARSVKHIEKIWNHVFSSGLTLSVLSPLENSASTLTQYKTRLL